MLSGVEITYLLYFSLYNVAGEDLNEHTFGAYFNFHWC